MAVLSDGEIRAAIAQGQLVPGGDPGNAEECSYAFKPGVAFFAGAEGKEVNFSTDTAARISVAPGRMIWIRTLEQIALPENLVGFWWQTNTLSRKGLMLVNMSMVEPGYKGALACLFVNFGNQKIVIDANLRIAKMVFIQIGGKVVKPYDKSSPLDDYDHNLREMSVNQPSSFLQIGEIASGLESEKSQALLEIQQAILTGKSEADRHFKALETDYASNLNTKKSEMLDQFKEDAPKAIWKTVVGAASVILVIGIVTTGASWAKDNWFTDTKKVAEAAAKDALRDRVIITSGSDDANAEEILNEISKVNERLDSLEKRVDR